jgi:hypothetical protein
MKKTTRFCGQILILASARGGDGVGPSELLDRINHFKKIEADFRLRPPILTLKSQRAFGCHP